MVLLVMTVPQPRTVSLRPELFKSAQTVGRCLPGSSHSTSSVAYWTKVAALDGHTHVYTKDQCVARSNNCSIAFITEDSIPFLRGGSVRLNREKVRTIFTSVYLICH